MKLSSKRFWADALERAARTVAQAWLAVLTISGTTLLNADLKAMAAVGSTAGVVSILMSVIASGNGDSASFIK